MTVISSKEFATNQKKIYDLAINERIAIKRGQNIFYLTCATFENDDEVYDLADAMAVENDEDINVEDYLNSIYERAKKAQ